MELLGKSLWDICNIPHRNNLSEQYVACVAVECLSILEGIHEKGNARRLSTRPDLLTSSLLERVSVLCDMFMHVLLHTQEGNTLGRPPV